MDFGFADGLSGLSSSIDMLAGQISDQRPQSELQGVLNAYPSSRKAIEMVQYYFRQNSQPSSPGKDRHKHDWSSASLRFQVYDEEVMNLFVRIAKHHLVETFPVLDSLHATEGPTKELELAYAAVGGLFCNVPGRFKVVNSMYNDARRMLLDPSYQQYSRSVQHKLANIKTYVLLEIYGLCSGDKRSYEFVEAFHARMLSAVEDYKKALTSEEVPSTELSQVARSLSESLHVLECYRVILLLRPPTSKIRSDLENLQSSSYRSSISKPDYHLTALFNSGSATDQTGHHQNSIIALSTISILAWSVLPRGFSLQPSSTLWKPEFIELALDNWARVISNANDWSTLLLYHLLHISLHSNMGFVQRFAHSPADSPLRAKSGVACRNLQQWQQNSHYVIAKWHAMSIVRRVKDAMLANRKRPSDNLNGGRAEGGNLEATVSAEPPHLPYCVYFAGLVMWCGSFVSAEEKTLNAAALDACSQLLSAMRVRVAELLDGILRGLQDVICPGRSL